MAAAEIRSGMVIRLEGDLYRVIHAEFHAGGGKMQGTLHAKLRKIGTDRVLERRFRQDERFDEVTLQRQTMQFLYEDADFCVFMHPETYEQVSLPRESLGPFLSFLTPDREVQVELLDGSPVEVVCPPSVEMTVDSTPEPLHLDDSSVFKEAILENGMEALVPQFVKSGDRIRVDVATGKYLERIR